METIRILGILEGFKGYILRLYGDNGKEHGNYYNILGYIGIIEDKMETTV